MVILPFHLDSTILTASDDKGEKSGIFIPWKQEIHIKNKALRTQQKQQKASRKPSNGLSAWRKSSH